MVFVPVAIGLDHFAPDRSQWIFLAAALAILPLAGWMGRATEELAVRTGEGVGGLLNATFGNAAELIIAITALRAGLDEVVKASLAGSIIGNILLVLGAAMLAGGVKNRPEQTFNAAGARSQATMLTLATIALILPAAFQRALGAGAAPVASLSLWISAVLLAVYAANLFFSLGTHRALFAGSHAAEEQHEAPWSVGRAVTVLGAATVAIAWISEILVGAIEAAACGLVVPILVGPAARIREIATKSGIDLAGVEIVDVPHSHAAADQAVALVREGKAELLMEGSLHSDELLAAVVAQDGLRTSRRVSHVFVMDIPTYHKVLIVTDAAINIAPTLDDKADICGNAIDLAIALGIARPKVAILAAVETVTSKMPSTIDAAALCKMAERGQISGGVLDGPLAFDNAISKEAARIKNITSEVAGDPDILLVPDLEAGNILAKQLTFLANADSAGLVLGARVPIILTSRADSVRARIASCAIAMRVAHARRTSPGAG
jgi:phosphotransacetylase